VGKTTLLHYFFNKIKNQNKKVKFLSFEKESDLALFNSIEDFKEYYKNYDFLIIDEFYYAENSGGKLKYLFDTTDIKFIISSFSCLELTFKTCPYLVGRIIKFELYPFFKEFL